MKPYEDLTPEEKKEICNGCGGKGGWVKPPHKHFFKADCDHHDYGYYRGGTEEDRKNCDKLFLQEMLADVRRASWLTRLRLTPWCYTYYAAVRLFGKKYFNYVD